MTMFPDGAYPDPEQEKIQRMLNEQKRQELAKRYGVDISPESNFALSADEEAAWLEQMERAERQFEKPTFITVRELLGNPHVEPLSALAPEELAIEVETLLEFMQLNGIAVDFLCEVDAAEAYRFIVEELFDKTTHDMRGTGMTTHFIYEEFHPNDEYDVKMWSTEFVRSLLRHFRDGLELALCQTEVYDRHGLPTTPNAIMRQADHFFKRHPTIVNVEIDVLSCEIEHDYATIELATAWTDVQANPLEMCRVIGRSRLRMKRSSDEYWEVVQASIAGWD